METSFLKPDEWVGFRPNMKTTLIGAYILKQVSTGLVYIGSTENIYNRRRAHLFYLRKGEHYNKNLQEAYNKDPIFNLDFYVTGVLGIDDKTISREKAFDMETFLIEEFNKKDSNLLLNIATDVRKSANGITRSLEHRQSISKAQSGKTLSEETRNKISLAKTGIPGKKKTPEQIAKEIIARTGIKRSEETKQNMRRLHALRIASMPPKEIVIKQNLVKKPVIVKGIHYSSLKEAQRAILEKDIRYKLQSPKYKDYSFA